MSKSGGLALFDFDGTITKRDTLGGFILFARGWPEYILGGIALSPVILLEKLNLIPSQRAKEMVLEFFFKGTPVHTFQELCERYAKEVIPKWVNKYAAESIANHVQNQDRVVVVSASPGHWVEIWASDNGLECIATRLEEKDQKITGKILGENCKGEVKVRRIKGYLNLDDYQEIYAYGDSKDDLPMLMLAKYSFYKPFRSKRKGHQ